MKTKMRGKDFITLMDYSKEEIESIFEVAFDLKKKLARGESHSDPLKNKSLASTASRGRVTLFFGDGIMNQICLRQTDEDV